MSKDRIFLSPPHMGETEMKYIKEAFNSNYIAPIGLNINEFEMALQNYLKQDIFATAVNSGTAAIHLALILAGVQTRDFVFCQSFTFCGSVNPVLYQGAIPIFIDSEAETWNLCPVLLEKAIIEQAKKGIKPKTLILVHLYGMPAKLKEIAQICDQYNITIIEDAAEALGSMYNQQACATFGNYGILSFNGNKIITTSAGGALITRNKETAQKALFLSTQAKEKTLYYEHKTLGFNYRMSNVIAGIGRGQMQVLEERIEQKRRVFLYYKNTLQEHGFKFLEEPKETFSNRWLTCMVCETEEIKIKIIKILEENNIESRPLWKPMHQQPLYKNNISYINGISENLFNKGICLPSGTNLTENELDRIIDLVKKVK